MLEAAVRLMGERGYEKTTLAAIGEAAGYSRGASTGSSRSWTRTGSSPTRTR
jgi:hypothetical protein